MHILWGLFCENCRITDLRITYCSMPKMLIAAFKDKKLPRRYEAKSIFQLIVNKLYKQPKTKTKQKKQIRLVIVSIGVYVVVKIGDEIYVLSIIKIYSYFSFAFCIVL